MAELHEKSCVPLCRPSPYQQGGGGADLPAMTAHTERLRVLMHALGRAHMYVLVGSAHTHFMENWCYDRRTLYQFAKHYETGQALPEDEYKKLKAAKNYRSASMMLRQVCAPNPNRVEGRAQGCRQDACCSTVGDETCHVSIHAGTAIS
eukprot:241976-Chlamydomonas_euryale.AAC.8